MERMKLAALAVIVLVAVPAVVGQRGSDDMPAGALSGTADAPSSSSYSGPDAQSEDAWPDTTEDTSAISHKELMQLPFDPPTTAGETAPETAPSVVVTPPELPQPVDPLPAGVTVAGYVTHWHMHRLPSVELRMMTHLIWQGVQVTSSTDATLQVLEPSDWGQVDEAVGAGQAAGVKVLVSLVGPWGTTSLNDVWASSMLRRELVSNLVSLVESYGLDGVDIDNENECERLLYELFIEELHDALEPLGKTITLAANPYRVCISPETSGYLDFINLMTYDMGAGQGYPYHSTYGESAAAMTLWSDAGIPKEKLLMGVPFYGRDAGTSHYDYGWIADNYNPGPDKNMVSAADADGGVIWFNGRDLVRQKVAYVMGGGFGGIMIYSVDTDATGASSLLAAIYDEILRLPEVEVR